MSIYNNERNVIFMWGGEISYNIFEDKAAKWPIAKKKKKTIKIYTHN
jgi:hypothetical protein